MELLLCFWTTSLAWARVTLVTLVMSVTLFTLATDTNGQESLQPYAPPILHSFLDSANVYPESVTVDQSSGTFFVGSVKEGTIYKGKIARTSLEVFSPGGADGRSIATGMFFANDRLAVVGRQTGLIFVYDTNNDRLISKLDTRREQLFNKLGQDGWELVLVTDDCAYIFKRPQPETPLTLPPIRN